MIGAEAQADMTVWPMSFFHSVVDFFNLTSDWLGAPVWAWWLFFVVIFSVLALDIGVWNRKASVLSLKRSVGFACFYLALASGFGLGVWWLRGTTDGALFFSAYLIEQTLSIDNVFVMSLIFTHFKVPREHRHRVLFWGILVAIILRAGFIAGGAALVNTFDWLLLIFALFLIWGGIKLFFENSEQQTVEQSYFVTMLTRMFRVHPAIHGSAFFVRRPRTNTGGGKAVWHATPLFVAFMSINVADVVFAIDSVPVVLSMTRDLFIIYTSNIFAIFGLRSMYFLIDSLMAKFEKLSKALSVLLVIIGFKIFADHYLGKVPPVLTLSVTVLVLVAGVAYAIVSERSDRSSVQTPSQK